jgi:methyl-accepting chemotaxis protein
MGSPEQSYSAIRRLVGPAILLVVILVAGGFLEAAVDQGVGAWLLRIFVAVGVLAFGAYLALVSLPQRRLERRLAEAEERYTTQCAALTDALDELRLGDLVAAVQPLAALPKEMRLVVEAATASLAALFEEIQSSSVEVATSAAGVRETAADLAAGSSQQAAAVVEITATMEELARTAGVIAHNAAGQAELAARAEAAGHDGAAALEAAVEGVEAVQQRIEVIAERADTLGSRAREIYRVLDLITAIAQETHILSLNAAIEAAAAGEHGERFSVVAEEVRRLAERSRESVDSVRSLLDEFSATTRAAVVATEEGSKAAERVLVQSQSTQESVAHLRNALTDTARAAREISLATEEQRTASDQVVVTLKEISEVIQVMADGLERFTDAADQLNHLALSIQLLTQSFRLSSEHSLKDRAIAVARSIGDLGATPEAVERRLGEVLEDHPYLELAYFVDRDGTMVAYAVNDALSDDDGSLGGLAIGLSYRDRPWFQAVRREHRAVVTPLYKSLLTGETCFTVASPVVDHGGGTVGTLGIDVNARNWTRI